MVRWRETSTKPTRIRRCLREVEGFPFDTKVWNTQRFTQHLFDRILAKGHLQRLCEHLEELAEDGVEIAGVLEMKIKSPHHTDRAGDHHALIYKYKLSGIIVHLWLHFSCDGIF